MIYFLLLITIKTSKSVISFFPSCPVYFDEEKTLRGSIFHGSTKEERRSLSLKKKLLKFSEVIGPVT